MNKRITTRLHTFVSIVAVSGIMLGFSAGTSSAFADEVSKVVRYSDLNLETSAGASALYHRIQAAAREVCSSYQDHDLRNAALRQRCFDDAVAGSVSQVNKSTVTALHNKTVGRVS